VTDADCTAFLQQALPPMGFRWAGFRKVRRQVCRRAARRITELGLDGWEAYAARIAADPAERAALDGFCRITISRFFRDRGVFEAIAARVLPDVAARAQGQGRAARAWSAGCASGEEPYTLTLLWDAVVAPAFPGAALSVVATDADPALLERARAGCYGASSLHEVEPWLVARAFERRGPLFCLRPERRAGVEFLAQDLRETAPEGPFDLILCRYLAFTYFDEPLQRRVLDTMLARLPRGGWLAIGTHERLPDDAGLEPVEGCALLFRKP
jgi:chemotaxis protein methyltransferase CheR